MNKRWKYQLVTGGLWGVFMTAFNVMFEFKEKPLAQQLVSANFYIRAVAFILVGIFVLGYFNWKAKLKREQEQK
jgi:hypothetical protein